MSEASGLHKGMPGSWRNFYRLPAVITLDFPFKDEEEMVIEKC